MTMYESLREIAASPKNLCFACGPGNPCGLHLRFERIDGVVRAEFMPDGWHQGWESVIHGGIVASVLDEAMAYTLYFDGLKGLTARMELRYRTLVREGDHLLVEARTVRRTRKLADIEARLSRDEEVVAEASARFMVIGPLDIERATSANRE